MEAEWKILLAVVAGAAALAFMAYFGSRALTRRTRGAGARVEEMAARSQPLPGSRYGTRTHRLRLAFARVGIEAAGRELLYLHAGRILCGAAIALLLHGIAGFPLLTSMVGFACGVLVVNSIVESSWARVRAEIEEEIPIFLTSFAATVQITQNVLAAVEEEARALKRGGALQGWLLERLVAPCQSAGPSRMGEVVEEAFELSSALGVSVFLIGRLWQTGGQEWEKAFSRSVENLEGVLEARISGKAAGASAKGSVGLIAAMTGFVILLMVRNPVLAETIAQPFIQMAYAGIVLLMVFGWGFMNRMIDDIF